MFPVLELSHHIQLNGRLSDEPSVGLSVSPIARLRLDPTSEYKPKSPTGAHTWYRPTHQPYKRDPQLSPPQTIAISQ